jgi:hypothetical protein
MSQVRVKLLRPLTEGNTTHEIGATIEMAAEDAKRLEAYGTLKISGASKAESAPKNKMEEAPENKASPTVPNDPVIVQPEPGIASTGKAAISESGTVETSPRKAARRR